MKLTLAALTFGALAVSSSVVHADNSSWAALKGKVTTKMSVAVSVDFVPMRKLAAFNTFVDKFVTNNPDLKQGLDLIKSTCSVDVTQIVSNMSVVINEDKAGVVAVGFDGIDRKGIEDCLGKIAAAKGEAKTITQKKVGAQTEYSVTGETDKLHLTWVGKNVVAMSTDPMDVKSFALAVGKGDKKSPLNVLIGKTTTTAPAWFAVAKADDLPGGQGKMTGVTGSMDIGTDVLNGTAKIAADTADNATKFVTTMTAGLPEVAKSLAKAPELAKVVKSIKLASTGADITVTGVVEVKSLPALVQQIMANMH